ncbi:alanine racemase [Terrarubrum flagellatum]|uniref:alanine racemase n=1 Tax=Terrirubrum flagellatum TaxID=2895980 RepID=UPI003144EED2
MIDDPFLAHGATLTIDLGALAANWRLMKQRAGEAEAGAVVKADAYGTGIEKAVPALAAAGCRTFFVAHLSEAKRVRSAAPNATIFVLNGFPPGAAELYRAVDARPAIGGIDEAREWSQQGVGACALHIDTGMNRLGFPFDSLDDAGVADAIARLNVDVVMTHFVASEVPDDPVNATQIARFRDVMRRFPDVRHSLLNSSGHFLDDAPRGHLTRPGYALYGGNPTPGKPNPMRQVVGLEARIVALSEVKDGERAGYNGLWTAKGPRKLATLSLGYADGIPRNAGGIVDWNGGLGLVGGVPCPFVGTVSMDLIIIDVSDVPVADARRGAPATIIGGPLTLEAVGAGGRTIGYEILTSLGRRYQRVYRD